MSCGNRYKHMMQNTYTPFIDAMSSEKNLSYEKLEYMQFGICDCRPEQVEEVPFFSLLIKVLNLLLDWKKRLFLVK